MLASLSLSSAAADQIRVQKNCKSSSLACRAPMRSRSLKVNIQCGAVRSANRTLWSKNLNESLSGGTDGHIEADPSSSVRTEIWAAAARLQQYFTSVDQLVSCNLYRVQQAFRRAKIGPHHYCGSTGYGHGDIGRSALDEVWAEVMGAEAALVRIQFVSGTHAIATALYTCLRPGDELLAVAGKPYDTLEEVIGVRGAAGSGSLKEWGVGYRELPLSQDGSIDWHALKTAISPVTRVALVQRSCGYALRPTLSIDDIRRAVECIKQQSPECIVVVDNCYGEFTEDREPCSVGADLCMGSLIKNPGGTIVPGGGYIAGRSDLITRAAARLTAPGVGVDAGQVSGETLRLMFQGLFMAPQTVGEALKGGRLVAQAMSERGFTVAPLAGIPATPSFITAIKIGSKEGMVAFCRAVQGCCPIGSYIEPVPGVTPGYGDEVIFADGTFIDGSTSELSADGPIRPPYVVYCQGGTHWTQWALALEAAIHAMQDLQPQEPAANATLLELER